MIAGSTGEKLETLLVAIQRILSPGPLFKDVSLGGEAYFARDLERFQLASLYVCIATTTIKYNDFGIICPHPKRTKYEKRPCSGGGAKLATWEASKGAGGDRHHLAYILKKALN